MACFSSFYHFNKFTVWKYIIIASQYRISTASDQVHDLMLLSMCTPRPGMSLKAPQHAWDSCCLKSARLHGQKKSVRADGNLGKLRRSKRLRIWNRPSELWCGLIPSLFIAENHPQSESNHQANSSNQLHGFRGISPVSMKTPRFSRTIFYSPMGSDQLQNVSLSY